MATADQHPTERLPGWAVDQATDELPDQSTAPSVMERAREIVRDAERLDHERHDEYDDPDQGGEG
jgi:hypothetical protein